MIIIDKYKKLTLFKCQEKRLYKIIYIIDKTIKKLKKDDNTVSILEMNNKRSKYYDMIYKLNEKINLLFGINRIGENSGLNMKPLSQSDYNLWVNNSSSGWSYNIYTAPVHPRNILNPYGVWLSGYLGAMFRVLESEKYMSGIIAEENLGLIEDFNLRKKLIYAIISYDVDLVKTLATVEILQDIKNDYDIMDVVIDNKFSNNLDLIIACFTGKEIFIQENLF